MSLFKRFRCCYQIAAVGLIILLFFGCASGVRVGSTAPSFSTTASDGTVLYKQVGLNKKLVDEAAAVVERHLAAM